VKPGRIDGIVNQKPSKEGITRMRYFDRFGWRLLQNSLLASCFLFSSAVAVASDVRGLPESPLMLAQMLESTTEPQPFTSTSPIEMQACRREMELFSRQLGDLMVSLDKLPPSLIGIGFEAAEQIPHFSDAELLMGCEVMRSSRAQGLDLVALREQFGDRERTPGCIGVQTYLGLSALRMVLDAYNNGAQAVCDANSCTNSLEYPFCLVLCIGVAAINAASEVISTRMDVADKCANLVHEEQMEDLRTVSRSGMRSLGVSARSAFEQAAALRQFVVNDEDLKATDDSIVAGFDGGGRQTGRGIGPALSELASAVEQGRSVQRDFERAAVQSRLEDALGSGATYSRMLRPRVHDGLLEDVRELVASRIQAFSEAGGDAQRALQHFRVGDDAFNASNYKGALWSYRRAYLSLRNPATPYGRGSES